jgi:hypothetical protein
MKKHFESATEKFEFTVDLGGWKGKKVFEFSPKGEESWSSAAIRELSMFGKSMNVSSITKQGLMMYDFDMLGNKLTAKIKWENVELGNTLDVPKDIPGFEGTKETLNNLSIFK